MDMDHDMEETDDPLQYLNTGVDNEVTMSQPYEYEMHVIEPERTGSARSLCSCNPRRTRLQMPAPPKLN